MNKITLSNMPKTWMFDVDGTIVEHNGHLTNGDKLLTGVKDFFETQINSCDTVILLTSRKQSHIENLKQFLFQNGIRFDHLIHDLPFGERILINDKKPSGLKTAFSINKIRNDSLKIKLIINTLL